MNTTINENVLTSIEAMINYLYHDEEKDYNSSIGDEAQNHIFQDIKVVSEWLAANSK